MREGARNAYVQEQVQFPATRLPLPRRQPAKGVPLFGVRSRIFPAGQTQAPPQVGARLRRLARVQQRLLRPTLKRVSAAAKMEKK